MQCRKKGRVEAKKLKNHTIIVLSADEEKQLQFDLNMHTLWSTQPIFKHLYYAITVAKLVDEESPF